MIADHLGCEGPVINVSSACAGAALAIGNAFHMNRRGEVALAIAGGADSVLNLDAMGALYLLGAASGEQRLGTDLCRPFDRDRSGLIAGEGGGFVVLERLEHALARGATPYAEVIGYGSSLDAYKGAAPAPQGRGRRACASASIAARAVTPTRPWRPTPNWCRTAAANTAWTPRAWPGGCCRNGPRARSWFSRA